MPPPDTGSLLHELDASMPGSLAGCRNSKTRYVGELSCRAKQQRKPHAGRGERWGFCDRNDSTKEWRIVGSVKGSRKFASEIRKYASNPANDRISEYQHFGPSMESRSRNLASSGNHRSMDCRSRHRTSSSRDARRTERSTQRRRTTHLLCARISHPCLRMNSSLTFGMMRLIPRSPTPTCS